MMKRRHYLICSIIAMLSIVSYACETEYATCDGETSNNTVDDSGNGPSENDCNGNIQRCALDLKGKQVCKRDKWKNNEACNYCFNENTDNSDAASLVCDGCTPNLYKESGTEVCYKGAFKKFESKSDSDPNPGLVTNSDPNSDDAPWEFAYNDSGSLKYYNCHNASVTGSMGFNRNALKVVKENSCCEENDYYIKLTGYKYYSIEVCGEIEVKGVSDTFMAYKYTEELNDSLIGQKSKLPYGFCYKDNIFLAVNDNVVINGESVYHRFACAPGRECSDDFNGLCITDDLIDGNKAFECANSDNEGDAVFIKYKTDNKTIATCPTGTELKIKDKNGNWSGVDCSSSSRLEFRIDEVRCAPIKSSNDRPTPHPKS